MRTLVLPVIALVLAPSVAGGCAGMPMPDLHRPGRLDEQRTRAVVFDPYPENEAGPPITGARPRDYQKPIAEPGRARWYQPWTWLP